MQGPRVLVLDDEPVCREVATRVFTSLGAQVRTHDCDDADLVVTDVPGRAPGRACVVLGPSSNSLTPQLELPLDRETVGQLVGRTPPPFDRQQLSAMAGGVSDAELEMVRDYFDFCAPQLVSLETAVGLGDVAAVYAAAHRLTSSVGLLGARRASNLLRAVAEQTHRGALDGVAELQAEIRLEVARLERSLRRFLEVRGRARVVALVGCRPLIRKVLERRLAGLGLELRTGPVEAAEGLAAVVVGSAVEVTAATREVRAVAPRVPILLARGRGGAADAVNGLTAGADTVFDPSVPARELCAVFDRWTAPAFDCRRLTLLYGSESAAAIADVWRHSAADHLTDRTTAPTRLFRAALAIGAGHVAAVAATLIDGDPALAFALHQRLTHRVQLVTDAMDPAPGVRAAS